MSDAVNPIPSLTPAQAEEAKANHLRLFSWLNQIAASYEKGEYLVSRGPMNGVMSPWRPTGFHVDDATHRLHAKIGDHPYQPIGWVQDAMLVLSDISRMVWQQEFAVVRPVPLAPPFKAEEIPMEEGFKLETEAEISRVEETLKELDPLIERYAKAINRSAFNEAKIVGDEIRTTINFYSLQLPSLNDFLGQLRAKHTEINADLTGADIGGLLESVVSWLRAKRDDLQVRISIQKYQIIPQECKHPAQILLEQTETGMDRVRILQRYWETFSEKKPEGEVDLEPAWEAMITDLRSRLTPASES